MKRAFERRRFLSWLLCGGAVLAAALTRRAVAGLGRRRIPVKPFDPKVLDEPHDWAG